MSIFPTQAEILELIYKLKRSEYRGEQAEMNIQRLNVRIDQVGLSYNLCLLFSIVTKTRWRRIYSARSTRSKSEIKISFKRKDHLSSS